MKATYVYLSDKERKAIEQVAKEKNLCVSSCIRQILFPELNGDNGILDPENLDRELESLNNSFSDSYGIPTFNGPRRNMVRIYFNDVEFDYVKRIARGYSLSYFIRNNLLQSGTSRFEFIVSTEDIKELTKQNDELNMHFAGFVGGLQFRDSVNKADFLYCQQLLKEINENTAGLKKVVLRNRYSIRQQGRRHLEKHIRNILGAEPKHKEDME